ncbi:MAG: tetratricopeptide repeat protein [Gammaproteobacteria bacterium]|nr:MAG: tetratricopeptide repeat protein [Gammaproteobacteria bacterium]
MAATEPLRTGSRIEAEVLRIRGLAEKREFARALADAGRLLEEVPENRDVLYLVAVSQRYLGRIDDALGTLRRFEELHPDFGRLFQERGHCYRTAGDSARAIEAYRQAVGLNPSLLASWKALAALCRPAGQTREAAAATEQALQLERLPAPVLSASGMLAEGDIYGAERILRQFLLKHGNHLEAMRLLAQIGVQLDVLDDAEFLLESVLAFDPNYHIARYDYAVVLGKRHKHAAALEEARKLLRIDPRHRAFRTVYATACVGLGDHEEALRVYRELLTETPHNPELHLSVAHALKTQGRQAQAIEAYRAAAAARADFGDAYWSLANLKTYRFADEELARMRALETAPATSLIDRYHLCFALGKALEDRGEYEESFRYYERGNAFKKSESRFDVGAMERNLRLQASLCTREFLAARSGGGCDRADPIFIVGLPRAGSTLLEQILASHSQVEGTMELADIPRMVQQLAGRENRDTPSRYPGLLAELTPAERLRLGEKYLADTRVYRTGRPYFIDKMPNNFRHIGLIHLILPKARIIDARREPLACCLSNFKQLFASGQEFTYSLEDLGRYYRAYVEIMAHWDAVLPGRILRVQHEELVEDLEHHVRRILDFVGLDFEPACLEFYKTERSIRTASSEQVRQPIYREGLDQWRNFEPWLGPLRAALGELVGSRGA